jgi:hypothetical protein
VRPVGVVEGHVLREHAAQVPFIEDEDVVEALIAQRAHDPLGDGIGLGRTERGQQRLNAEPRGTRYEAAAVDAVPISAA